MSVGIRAWAWVCWGGAVANRVAEHVEGVTVWAKWEMAGSGRRAEALR